MTLETQSLCYSYGSRQVLNNVSISCSSGSLVALLGENGSGKSTLLTCLAGLRLVDGVRWDGVPTSHFNRHAQSRLRAMVPQRPRFDGSMSLYDYVLLGRKPLFRWKERKIDHFVVENQLTDFGLAELAFQPISEVSGGERQKAVLARALVQETPLLLLDEPLNNLDLRFQITLMDLLATAAQKTGKLVITALHDVNVALSWCDSVVMLKKGELVAAGAMEEALSEDSLEEMAGIRMELRQEGEGRCMLLPQRQSCFPKEKKSD